MNLFDLGVRLARNRRRAGLTQKQLAERMSTKQSVIARVESGAARPSIEFLDRFASATGIPIEIVFGAKSGKALGVTQRRQRVKAVLGEALFDPWLRDPSGIEQTALRKRGLHREHFQGKRAAS